MVLCFYSVKYCFKIKQVQIEKQNVIVELNNNNIKENVESEENFTNVKLKQKKRDNLSKDNLIEIVDFKVDKNEEIKQDTNSEAQNNVNGNQPEMLIFNNEQEKGRIYNKIRPSLLQID